MSNGEYTSRWSQPEKTETLQLRNGFTIRYLRIGNGPPLVLLHTIRTQLDYFEKLVPALKHHYKVYALDLPGHGQSSILQTEYTEELIFRPPWVKWQSHHRCRCYSLCKLLQRPRTTACRIRVLPRLSRQRKAQRGPL